jgi:molybdopterin/thiamine biosynthesis adenylyltransferase
MNALADRRVLFVGAGGLGSPVATLLARAGVGHIEVIDDDQVELSNLQRQTLYTSADVGRGKAQLAAAGIEREAHAAGHASTRAVAREMRLCPDTATELVGGFDLVVEGTDNYPTKFLTCDACAISKVPCVQAGAVRWVGWVMGSLPGHSACLRCAFEDIPAGPDRGCSEAGVLGPVVGVIGALQASVALRLLLGDAPAAGVLHHYRGLTGSLRRLRVAPRQACPTCSGHIQTLDAARYLPQECAA